MYPSVNKPVRNTGLLPTVKETLQKAVQKFVFQDTVCVQIIQVKPSHVRCKIWYLYHTAFK
jgi:hypothetical protein